MLWVQLKAWLDLANEEAGDLRPEGFVKDNIIIYRCRGRMFKFALEGEILRGKRLGLYKKYSYGSLSSNYDF